MSDAKKVDMQLSNNVKLKPITKQSVEKKRMIQIEVNHELWTAVERELKSKKITQRAGVEWGLKAFLITHNTTEARKLGLIDDE